MHSRMLACKPTLIAGEGISKPYVGNAHGGIMLDPDLNPDSDDDDTPRVKILPPICKGLPRERPDAHIYATEDWMEAMCFRQDHISTNLNTL